MPVGIGVGKEVGEELGSFVGEGVGSSVVVVVVSISVVSSPHMGASNSGAYVGAISDPSPQQSILAWSGVQHGRRPVTSISV